MTDRSVNIAMNVSGADESRQQIDSVKEAMEHFGEAGVENSDRLTNVLRNIETAQDKVNRKIEEGRSVTSRDGKVMIQQFVELKAIITETFGSIANAPPAIAAAFAKASGQFNSTTAKIREMNDATAELKQTIAGNSAEFESWHRMLIKLAGANAELVIRLMGSMEAFHKGWEAGEKFAGTLEYNEEVMKSVSEGAHGLKEQLGALQLSFDDVGASALNLASDVITGDFERAKEDVKSYANDVIKLGIALSGGKEAVEQWNTAREAGLTITQMLTASQQKLNEVEDLHKRFQNEGMLGLKLYNQVMEEHQGDINGISETLKKLLPEVHKYNEAIAKAEEAIDKENEKIKAKREHLQKLLEQEQLDIEKITDTVKAIGTEDEARQRLNATIKGEIDALQKIDHATDGSTRSIQELARHINELSGDAEGNAHALDALVGKLKSAADGTDGLSDSTKKAIDAITGNKSALQAAQAQLEADEKALHDHVKATQNQTLADEQASNALGLKLIADRDQIEQLKTTIQTQSKVLIGTAENTTATKSASDAQVEITKTASGATEVHNKLGEAAKKAAESLKEQGSVASDTGAKISIVGNKIKIVGDHLEAMGPKVEPFRKVMNELSSGFQQTVVPAATLTKQIDALDASYKRATDSAIKLIEAQKRVAAAGGPAMPTAGEPGGHSSAPAPSGVPEIGAPEGSA